MLLIYDPVWVQCCKLTLIQIQITAVNWNQRIHGPLSVPPADVEPYFKAYVLLGKLIESSERILQFRLLPGQVISMNNWRVLHGRNAFQGGSRYLQVSYIIHYLFSSFFNSGNVR